MLARWMIAFIVFVQRRPLAFVFLLVTGGMASYAVIGAVTGEWQAAYKVFGYVAILGCLVCLIFMVMAAVFPGPLRRAARELGVAPDETERVQDRDTDRSETT